MAPLEAPMRHTPEATFTQTTYSDQQIAAMADLLRQIAMATDESEMGDGMPWEDACPTINNWIESAREVTGIDPGHEKLFCVECQTGIDECTCEEGGDD